MSRRPRGWLGLAACLVLVAAISLITGDRDEAVPVSYADVAVGQTGVSSDFEAQVLDVQLAQQVRRDDYTDPLVTEQRFVVVQLSVDSRAARYLFTSAVWLLTVDGDRYGPRPEFIRSQPSQVEPGFTGTGTFVFEVPADRVAGARLLVEPNTPLFLTYDVTVRIDLGLTEGTPVVAEPVLPDVPTIEVTR